MLLKTIILYNLFKIAILAYVMSLGLIFSKYLCNKLSMGTFRVQTSVLFSK
jgi:hypothetical protein